MDWFDIKGYAAYKGWTLNRGEIGRWNRQVSRLGVKGFEDLSRGLKAIYQIEFGVPLANGQEFKMPGSGKYWSWTARTQSSDRQSELNASSLDLLDTFQLTL